MSGAGEFVIARLAADLAKSNIAECVADADRFRRAERFLFSNSLPPDLLTGGRDFADQLSEFGLLRLPYDLCAFQIGPVLDDDSSLPAPETYYFCVVAWHDGPTIVARESVYNIAANGPRWSSGSDATIIIRPGDTFAAREKITATPDDRTKILPAEQAGERCSTSRALAVGWLFAAIGCLNSDGMETNFKPAPKWINARRERKGELPILSHRIVTVDPSRVRMPGLVAGDGSHVSPRLHWRRGHIRRMLSGKIAIVRPCLVGDPARGEISKEYRVASRRAVLS